MEYIDSQYEEDEKTIADHLDAFMRRRGWATGVFTGLLVISLLVAFLIPPTFRSSSMILIEQQEIPQDLVRSTITSYADQRIQVISHRVLTHENMLSIIKKYNLYEREREREPTEYILEMMREDIHREMLSADVVDPRNGRAMRATIAFMVGFNNEDAKVAQQVANELTSLFLNENLETRTKQAVDTEAFLNDEADKLREVLQEQERLLASFKQENANTLPELLALNHKLYDRSEQEMLDVRRQLTVLKERGDFLKNQLTQLEPHAMVYRDLGGKVMSPEGNLKMLKAQYVALKSKYSDDHPDILRTKREIESIQRQLGMELSEDDALIEDLRNLEDALVEAKKVYTRDHPDIKRLEKAVLMMREALTSAGHNVDAQPLDEEELELIPDNPAYLQLQAQLAAVESEMRSLSEEYRELKIKMKDYEYRLMESPQVERRYRELVREYDNAAIKFREIKDKQLEAQLAKSLESERKGERFTMLEPPRIPEAPVSPNRMAIGMVGFMLALIAAIATVFLMEAMDEGLRSSRQISYVSNQNILAVIPYIETDTEVEKTRRTRYIAAAIALLGLIAALVAVHFVVMPMDVMIHVLLRNVGL